jgi:hypothetical protein
MLRSLLGTPYSSRQMGYDLQRLTRKGLVTRLDHQRRYVLTPFGQRVALFSHQGPRPHPASGTPGARPEFHRAGAAILRTTFTALDRAIEAHIAEAQLAARSFCDRFVPF